MSEFRSQSFLTVIISFNILLFLISTAYNCKLHSSELHSFIVLEFNLIWF